jgi:hypothetical protein
MTGLERLQILDEIGSILRREREFEEAAVVIHDLS